MWYKRPHNGRNLLRWSGGSQILDKLLMAEINHFTSWNLHPWKSTCNCRNKRMMMGPNRADSWPCTGNYNWHFPDWSAFHMLNIVRWTTLNQLENLFTWVYYIKLTFVRLLVKWFSLNVFSYVQVTIIRFQLKKFCIVSCAQSN